MAVAAPARSLVTAYAERVMAGDVLVGRLVRLACERHLRDIETGSLRGLWFDDAAAEHALGFFRFVCHSKGEWAGQPVILAPWQEFIVGSLFGWKRADGLRRFRRAYLSVARKNGKTTLAAALGLLLAFFDGEPGAEVYTAATTEEQARICWSEAYRMVVKSPHLASQISHFSNSLSRDAGASIFKPLSKESESHEGKNPHGAIIDEYHAHPTDELASVIELGIGSRRQPMIIYTTTAGTDGESPCRDLDNDVVAILEERVVDDATFGYIARPDDDDPWQSAIAWAKANPNLGVSVKLDNLEAACEKAKRTPREEPEFIRKRCNRWTQQAKRWLRLEDWDACDAPIDADALTGQRCFSAADLASTTDLTAFALVFPDGAGGYDALWRFWMPEDNVAERTRLDGAPYQAWIDAGYITPTEGNITDYDVVREEIRELASTYYVEEIAYDRWNATQLATQLTADGATCVAYPQTFSALNEPSRLLESLVLSRSLRHGGNPVARWMIANVAIKEGPNRTMRPVKGNPTARIDGVVALIMALGRAIAHQADAGDGFGFWDMGDSEAAL